MTLMLKEINETPSVLDTASEYNARVLSEIAEEYASRKIAAVVTAARGSSDNACTYFKYLFETVCKKPVASAAPSVFSLYGSDVDMSDCLVIGVSQSGKAADVLEVVNSANKCGALTVTVTNDLSSPLAGAGKYHLYTAAGEEKSVAATKTFSAQIFLLAKLCAAISGNAELNAELASLPAKISRTLAAADKIRAAAEEFKAERDLYVLSRGLSYGIALETALKIMETTYIRAKAFAVSDFHHGPFAVIDDKTKVILLAPNDAGLKDTTEMLTKLKGAGAFVTVFTDKPESFDDADDILALPSAGKFTNAFVLVAAVQVFAEQLSSIRGLNPDNPRGLKKVTITK